MKKKRIIPIILLKNGWVVQSKEFSRFQNLGNPSASVKRFSEWMADELIYLDISRDDAYDLRRDDKIYLYLNNIDNSSPFAILNYEGIANAEIKFENEIVLDKLDIVFKNSKGNLYNFHGLNHNLTFNLTSL